MPLLYIKNTPSGKLGVWEIQEDLDQLKKMYTPINKEIKKIETIISVAKQQQWFATRVLMRLLDDNAVIEYDNYNKPYLKNSSLHVSISHTSKYVAVLMDAARSVGVDVEKVSDKINIISGKFMSTEEMDAVSTDNKLEHLTLYWCAKEAIYKLYGKKELLFKEHIKVKPFEYAESGNINVHLINDITDKFYKLYYENLDDHKLVYSINE